MIVKYFNPINHEQVAPGMPSIVLSGDRCESMVTANGIGFGVDARAAVRMHLTPAPAQLWTSCHKPAATAHFQRWKVATLS
jgi:hypothetical protein